MEVQTSWEETGKGMKSRVDVISPCYVYLKTMGLLLCADVFEKTRSYFPQYLKATLDVQLLLPRRPCSAWNWAPRRILLAWPATGRQSGSVCCRSPGFEPVPKKRSLKPQLVLLS